MCSSLEEESNKQQKNEFYKRTKPLLRIANRIKGSSWHKHNIIVSSSDKSYFKWWLKMFSNSNLLSEKVRLDAMNWINDTENDDATIRSFFQFLYNRELIYMNSLMRKSK